MRKYIILFMAGLLITLVSIEAQIKKPIIKQKQSVVNYKLKGSFKGGLALVFYKGKCGLINKKGEIVVPIKYSYFNNNNAQIKLHDSTDDAGSHSSEIFRENGKYGLKDFSGNIIVQCIYEEVGYLSDELVAVKLNNKWGFVDKTGNVIVPIMYDQVGSYNSLSFSEGLAGVRLVDKWGYVNKKGEVVIPTIFDYVMEGFCEGLSMVKLNNKWGFIDKKGKIIIPIVHPYAWLYE